MSSRQWYRLLVVAAAVWSLLAVGEASAAVFSVNSTADQVDADPGDGVCADSAGKCTLRAAIQEANATVAADTVRLRNGLYRLTIPGIDEYGSATGDLNIRHSLTLVGSGASRTIIDGNGLDRVFRIDIEAAEQGKVNVTSLTIQNGSAAQGGGIWSTETAVRMKNCNILRNRAAGPEAAGGGVHLASGSLSLTGCKVRHNIASGTGFIRGGGMFGSGLLTINASDVSVNTALSTDGAGSAAGISWEGSQALTITGGRIANNHTAGVTGAYAGGIYVWFSQTTIVGTRIMGNIASCTSDGESQGGGGLFAGGHLNLKRVTISGNVVSGIMGYGGGLLLKVTNQIAASSISNNQIVVAGSGSGGGIRAEALNLISSSVTENSVSASRGEGAGLYVQTAALIGSVVKDNALHGSELSMGGGINSRVHLTLIASRVESNSAVGPEGYGGGIYSGGTDDPHDLDIMRASRIQFNFASSDGGGLFQDLSGGCIVTKSANSVVSGNLPDNIEPPLP
jgi:CSLREA domain-containing protein